MKNLTAKEIEHEIGCDGIIFGSGNKPTYTTKQRIEMIKQYAKDEVKKENTRLHDRFIEVIPVSYFESPYEFLEMKDLIFNETFDLYEKPKKKKDLLCVKCGKKLPEYLKFKHFECRQKQKDLK